jgi:hypothetical protein
MLIRKTIHEVEPKSNLDLILRGFNGAVNRFADVLGAGLHAIALALSTPHDNSAQVQAKIDELASQIRAQANALKTAVDNQTKEK